jgi:hypothetical protein
MTAADNRDNWISARENWETVSLRNLENGETGNLQSGEITEITG